MWREGITRRLLGIPSSTRRGSWRQTYRALRFEPLETRDLLTIFGVNTFADAVDFNPGDGVADIDSITPGAQTSLRAAIQEANAHVGDDEIHLGVGTYKLTLGTPIPGNTDDAEGDLDITDTTGSLTITADGAYNNTIIDANGLVRVLEVYAGAVANLTGVALFGGRHTTPDSFGGGGVKNQGSLTLLDSLIYDNEAIAGAGIWNSGQLTLFSTIVANNRASNGEGGGIFSQNGIVSVFDSIVSDNHSLNGGGIYVVDSTLTLSNTMVGRNSAHVAAGIWVDNNGGQSVEITNATITRNDPLNDSLSGGLLVEDGNVLLVNTIVAQNSQAPDIVCFTPVDADSHHNLIGDGTGLVGISNESQFNQIGTSAAPIDARLNLYELQGVPIAYELLGDSPAIDAGDNTLSGLPPGDVIDQPRVVDGDQDGSAVIDIGSFEFQNFPIHRLITGSGDGNVVVSVDGYGSFGSGAYGVVGNAVYDPVGSVGVAGTSFLSGMAIRKGPSGPRTLLTASPFAGVAVSSPVEISGSITEATSVFETQGLRFTLTQKVSPIFDGNNIQTGSLLTQTYVILNPTIAPIDFELVRYLNASLFFDATNVDGGGRIVTPSGEFLFSMDAGGTGSTDTTFVGIDATGGAALPSNRFEVEAASSLPAQLLSGGALDDQITGDSNFDGFIDPGSEYNTAMAYRNVFSLNAGASTTYRTQTLFGSGTLDDIPPVAANDSAMTNRNAPVVIDVVANDVALEGLIDPTTVVIRTGPEHGDVDVNPSTGEVTYTPDAGYAGPDSFTYDVQDSFEQRSHEATVDVLVAPLTITTKVNGVDANSAPGPYVLPGGTATITYSVKNNSSVPITGVVVSDDNGTPGNPSDDVSPTRTTSGDNVLDPDETWEYTTGHFTTIGPWKYIGSVTGTTSSQEPVADSGPANFLGVPSFNVENVATPSPEGNTASTPFMFTVTLTSAAPTDLTLNYQTHDGGAQVSDDDYQSSTGTFMIPSGETQGFITIAVNGDTKTEGPETFSVEVNYLGGVGSDTGVATIENDDLLPSLSIVGPAPVTEGNSGTALAVFTVSLSPGATQQVTVQFATTDGTATTADSDYLPLSSVLTFAVGQTQKVIPVSVIGDTKTEAGETFFLDLFNSVGASNATSVATKISASGTILNDDGQPLLTINDESHQEGDDSGQFYLFTAALSNASSETLTVSYTSGDSSAAAGSDYTAASGTITFEPGQTSQVISVEVKADTFDEIDETFFVNLSSSDNLILADPLAVGTIEDDDAEPAVLVTVEAPKNEGNSGSTDFVFTVSLTAASEKTVTINYHTTNGTATIADSDYLGQVNQLVFAPTETSKLVTISVLGDTRNELDETFSLELANPVNATLASGVSGNSFAEAVILNDDPVPSISINDVTAPEGDAATTGFVFHVTLSAASGRAIAVEFATADGTALASENDYTAITGVLTFAPDSLTLDIVILVHGDLLDETDETFFVNLSSPTNATLANDSGLGTIQDESSDDIESAFVISDVTVTPNGTGTVDAVLTVTRTGVISSAASVEFATANGTAVAGVGADYQATLGPLNFLANDDTEKITVVVLSDSVVESEESFFVNLSNPIGAAILDPQGEVKVLPGVTVHPVVQWQREVGGNGNHYELIDTTIDWATAKAYAESRTLEGIHGRLVTIASGAENLFLTNAFGPDSLHLHWIGGLQPAGSPEPAGGWGWITSEGFDFDNWSDGEPNNFDDTEDRIVFDHGTNELGKEWNDLVGTALVSGYVVEYDVPPEVDSIIALDPARLTPSENKIEFTVTFSENVKGVDPSDFEVEGTAGVHSTIDVLMPTEGVANAFTVIVTNVGPGTLRLRLKNDGTIKDLADNPLVAGAVSPDVVISPALVDLALSTFYKKPVTEELVPVPGGSKIRVGETVVFEYHVTNPGGEALSELSLVDDNGTIDTADDLALEPVGGDTDSDEELDPGETWIYHRSHTVTPGNYQSTATVHAVGPTRQPASDQASAKYFGADPRIDVQKFLNGVPTSTPGPSMEVNTPISFTYVVHNDGNIPLHVSLVDDNATPGDLSDDVVPKLPDGDLNKNGLLDPGEEWTYAVSATAIADAHQAFVTATAEAAIDFGSKLTVDIDSTAYQGTLKPPLPTQPPLPTLPQPQLPVRPTFLVVDQPALQIQLRMSFDQSTSGPGPAVIPPAPGLDSDNESAHVRTKAVEQVEDVLLTAFSESEVFAGDTVDDESDIKERTRVEHPPDSRDIVLNELDDLEDEKLDGETGASYLTWRSSVLLSAGIVLVGSLAALIATRWDVSKHIKQFNWRKLFTRDARRPRFMSIVDRILRRS